MSLAAVKAAENHRDEWGVTWYLQWDMYKPIPTLISKIQELNQKLSGWI